MKQRSIAIKIWLSISIFVVGFICSTVLVEMQGMASENALRAAWKELFPAAQLAQDVDTAFQSAVRGFSDAVVIQDISGIDRAGHEGALALTHLRAVSAMVGLPPGRANAARELVPKLDRFLIRAGRTYGEVVGNPLHISRPLEQRMKE